jgi:hypothetical protein
MFDGSQRCSRLDPRPGKIEQIIDEYWLGFEHVKSPAAKAAALPDEHAVVAALWHFDLGGDREGLVEHARRGSERHASDGSYVGKLVASGHDARARQDERVSAEASSGKT